jgi:hypothetical protein
MAMRSDRRGAGPTYRDDTLSVQRLQRKADLDTDVALVYVAGQQYGDVFWCKFHAPER